jgi:CIC family chloride channel protein
VQFFLKKNYSWNNIYNKINMKKNNVLNNGIPISISLNPLLEAEDFQPRKKQDKKRLLIISCVASLVAVIVSFIAKLLVYLIDLFTNISFRGSFSITHFNPSENTLGLLVIIIPALGGIIVGLMALYGSKAIRGHGIPEAMEQILTNQSKIKPAITYLKPLSSAISIGTGGPFGAEGPIIATGGALGSTIGQLLKISHNERKILLAAGATAGMSAIFGSPIAAIFLAIELLLFEFSPRSLIPVSIACIIGAAGHHLLFGQEPVFIMNLIPQQGNMALILYSILGIIIGILSAIVTKSVYFIEDCFEKLPIHWMWWPAIGGLVVGTVGYVSPPTLGVGYENITALLSGNMSIQFILSICILKFISWAVALGSGTSGGTLAPLLTIGGAIGALLGTACIYLFPEWGVILPLAALVGMSAMFAGASRALLTSIIFAMETTSQSNALLPLLCACIASYFVSFFLMKNTIMTEKIARRGVQTPNSYEQDILEKIPVEHVMKQDEIVLSEENTIKETREWFNQEANESSGYFIIVSNDSEYRGIIHSSYFLNNILDEKGLIGGLVKNKSASISIDDNLKAAVQLMAKENTDVLAVVAKEDKNNIVGVLSYKDIILIYKNDMDNYEKKDASISLKRRGLKILLKGQKFMAFVKEK